MALVTHKYMVGRIPPDELRSTFAAREHTLDYLVKEMRRQIGSRTLKSYLVYGPRGSGKTTIVRMLSLRLGEDEGLRTAWLPVLFPEECPSVTSLRDLLSEALRLAAEQGIAHAAEWHDRAEEELRERASCDLALQGLRAIAREQARRPILIVENIDQCLSMGERGGIDDMGRKALRRILTEPDPCFMIVGTALRTFPELKDYDEALYAYFQPVPLGPLDDQGVRAVLLQRAQFDGYTDFESRYRVNQDKIRALTRLAGGNPRVVMMLYEVVTLGAMGAIARELHALVDSMTPLLKDVIEHQMTPYQAKVFDALMRAGGTAQPRDLAKATRLSLNAVSTHLSRLKDMQFLELHGGGKGRPAHYSAADRMLAIWYQLRFLRPNARRIELFVEFLRLWLEEDVRFETLRRLSAPAAEDAPRRAADTVLAAEYFAASMDGTAHEESAREIVLRAWMKCARIDQAALALAEFEKVGGTDPARDECEAYSRLSNWSLKHGDMPAAVSAAEAAIARNSDSPDGWCALGVAAGRAGDHQRAQDCFSHVLAMPSVADPMRARSHVNRGIAKGQRGDVEGAIADYSAAIELPGAPVEQVARALVNRGLAKGQRGDVRGAVADFSAGMDHHGVSADERRRAATCLIAVAPEASLDESLAHVRRAVDNTDMRERVASITGILRGLSGLKDRWLRAWQKLTEAQPMDVMASLQFLAAVATVLETGDRSTLDPLPPEQRDFAIDVLAGFGPTTKGPPSP